LAPGSLTQTYPVRYTTQKPDWTDDTNKTRAYWMRRLRAGTFTMGTGETFFSKNPIATSLPSHNVTLTNDFYIAVFETTQQQWHHVMGTWPSFFTNAADRASRPVEKVKMSQIRGGTEGIKWPEGTRVDAGSFVALVRERSGLAAFDLPTEAQWEFACRAGTTDKYYSADWDEKTFARYANNGGKVLNAQGVLVDPLGDVAADDGGTARVGSYAPNPWGLYDMAGNVFELLLDRHSFDVSPSAYQVAEVEPVGLTAAQQPNQNERVGRGGGCTHGIDSCSSYFRRPVSSAISVCGCRFVVPVQK
jgi:formylglycine-generating enzyme required for sulfatase activity